MDISYHWYFILLGLNSLKNTHFRCKCKQAPVFHPQSCKGLLRQKEALDVTWHDRTQSSEKWRTAREMGHAMIQRWDKSDLVLQGWGIADEESHSWWWTHVNMRNSIRIATAVCGWTSSADASMYMKRCYKSSSYPTGLKFRGLMTESPLTRGSGP